MDNPEKKFIKKPHLDGGKDQLKKFIRENLQYPEKALEKGIEGDVIVKYKVTGKGEVIEPEIVKGLGYGCDEEAIRLVEMLNYQSAKNRGIKVITDNKIKIPFRIKHHQKKRGLSMSYKPADKKAQQPKKDEADKEKKVYTYTIRLP